MVSMGQRKMQGVDEHLPVALHPTSANAWSIDLPSHKGCLRLVHISSSTRSSQLQQSTSEAIAAVQDWNHDHDLVGELRSSLFTNTTAGTRRRTSPRLDYPPAEASRITFHAGTQTPVFRAHGPAAAPTLVLRLVYHTAMTRPPPHHPTRTLHDLRKGEGARTAHPILLIHPLLLVVDPMMSGHTRRCRGSSLSATVPESRRRRSVLPSSPAGSTLAPHLRRPTLCVDYPHVVLPEPRMRKQPALRFHLTSPVDECPASHLTHTGKSELTRARDNDDADIVRHRFPISTYSSSSPTPPPSSSNPPRPSPVARTHLHIAAPNLVSHNTTENGVNPTHQRRW
ncbi:hypothetical protein R3P38DRAFT_3581617 [Favolaschia claudopus]|uniref:Uncharacterized protein n=1 Tax=Favolaschia claudopus TaxID=2862362 RepID=A0AAW0AJX0_9AGAR